MTSPAAIALLVAGAAATIWPYELSLWQERWDSIGSRRDYGDVEPASWRVTLTRVGGVLLIALAVAFEFVV